VYGTLTWPRQRAAVGARLEALGASLERLGFLSGEVVGVLAHNSGAHLEAWLGISAHGRVINGRNLRLAVAEQRLMIEDCEPAALVVNHEHLEGSGAHAPSHDPPADRGRRSLRRFHV
jgi:acyl-CoA synthetase (AMP-forming)/AMP-acid ligase II